MVLLFYLDQLSTERKDWIFFFIPKEYAYIYLPNSLHYCSKSSLLWEHGRIIQLKRICSLCRNAVSENRAVTFKIDAQQKRRRQQ